MKSRQEMANRVDSTRASERTAAVVSFQGEELDLSVDLF